MPNLKELMSLSELACNNPAINVTYFPSTPLDTFWSSTPYTDGHFAWTVNARSGKDYYMYKDQTSRVRLVRAGQ